MKQAIATAVLVIGIIPSLKGQPFTNLDFEDAIVNLSNPQFVGLDWAIAAPGWSHSDGSSTAAIYYPRPHIGSSQWFLLIDSATQGWSPLGGDYSLALRSGTASSLDPNSEWVWAWIAQNGEVPTDAKSIRISAQGEFQVLLGGTEISMQSLGGSGYAGDVSSFAAATVELKIIDRTGAGHPLIVDDVFFSPLPVPEPSVAVLMTVGASCLLAFYRSRHRIRIVHP